MAFWRFHADFQVRRPLAGTPPIGKGAHAHAEHDGKFAWREQIVTHCFSFAC
jgi:hypothetical protein